MKIVVPPSASGMKRAQTLSVIEAFSWPSQLAAETTSSLASGSTDA
ncbi:hypothetical protein [Streptomyces sp. NPDC004685]